MVIKYLALRTVMVADEEAEQATAGELLSQDGGVLHAMRDRAAWRDYFELKEREKGSPGARDEEIPPDMEGHYFL